MHLIPAQLDESNLLINKDRLIQNTLKDLEDYISRQTNRETLRILLSTQNYLRRSNFKYNDILPISIGDVCYIDFGQAYLNEAGYQHFGLIIALMNGKAFVVPMTSNALAYQQAYDELENHQGKRHLMRFGQIHGLNKPSVLFLNDSKFINTSRIIEVKGHISIIDPLFIKIKQRVYQCIL